MRRWTVIIVTGVLALAACARGQPQAQQQPAGGGAPSYEFYVVEHGSSGDPYWEIVKKGAEDAARLYGVKMTWLNPEQFSIQKLVDLMNSAVAANPDGILATITDPEAVAPPLTQAIQSGIPVIAIDTADPRPFPERIPYLFYIGSDEYQAGRRAAERFLQEGPVPRAVCASHEQGNIALELRCKGYREVIEANGGVVDNLDIGQDPSQIQQQIQSYLQAHPDTKAVLTLGPIGAIPTIQLIEQQGLAGKVLHGTFDLDPTTNQSILDGSTLFTIDAQPYLIGYQGIVMLYLYNRYGFTVGSDLLTGPAIVDKSNVEKVMELSEQRIR
jgi:simple sugar transport system substrate-binding protein